jgi:acyl dehydratase
MKTFYFEEIEVGQMWESSEYLVTRDDIIAFAKRWDPQPFHIDDEAGARSIFGTLTACVAHTFAIHTHLVQKLESQIAMLAGLAITKFELPHPVRPLDWLRLERHILAKRLSSSKSDRGIITTDQFLKNQDDHLVMDSRHKIMVSCRPTREKDSIAV